MRKSFFAFIAFALVLLVGVVSCRKDKNETVDEATEFRNSLTAKDSTEVMEISDKFMATLKKGDVEGAISQLVLIDTGRNIKPLTEEIKSSLRRTFATFPVLDYTIQTFELMRPDSNFVRYRYVFAESADSVNAPTIQYSTMPMKINGKWYLTLPGYVEGDSVQTKTGIHK